MGLTKWINSKIQQGKDAVQKVLYTVELPPVLGQNLELWKSDKAFLNYNNVDEIIDNLDDYTSAIKGLPGNFNELKRVSGNFCTHVTSALVAYRKSMLKNVDSNSFEDYKIGLCDALDEISKQCENRSVLKLKQDYYKDVFEVQSVKFGGENKYLGDFAEALGKAADTAKNKINKLTTFKDKIDNKNLFEAMCIDKLSKFNKFTAEFKGGSSHLVSGAVSRLAGKVISGAKRKVSSMFVQENLEPVEFYLFKPDDILGRSTVHALLNILNSYLKALSKYSKNVKQYVTDCSKVIKNIIAILSDYLSALEVFMNPDSSQFDKINAKQQIKGCLDELLNLKPNDDDQSLFVLINTVKDTTKPPRYARASDYNAQRIHWPSGCSDQNVDGVPIVLRGWSFGDFLLQMLPVVTKTKADLDSLINTDNGSVNYQKLEIKARSATATQDKKLRNNINELLIKAVAYRKEIASLYAQVQDLCSLEKFRKETKDDYNRIFGNRGIYSNFLGFFTNISTITVNGTQYDLIKNNRICANFDSIGDLNAIQTHCSISFAGLTECVNVIRPTCERWIKYYSKEANEHTKKQVQSKNTEEQKVRNNVQLFKKTFADQFKKMKAIFDEANKKFDEIVKSKIFDNDDDVSANYQRKLTADLQNLLNHGIVSLTFEHGPLVVFGPNGLNEANLYNGIRSISHLHASNFEIFLTYAKKTISEVLATLRSDLAKFDKMRSDISNLFSKKNAAKLKQERAIYNQSIKKLEGAIKNYKKAQELYERFGDICAHVHGLDSPQDACIFSFKNSYEIIKTNYAILVEKHMLNGNFSIDKAYVLDNPELPGECVDYISNKLKSMQRLLPQIEATAESMQEEVPAASTAHADSAPRKQARSGSSGASVVTDNDKFFQDLQTLWGNYVEYGRLLENCKDNAKKVGFHNEVRMTDLEEKIRGSRFKRKKEENKTWEEYKKQYDDFSDVYKKLSKKCKIFDDKKVLSNNAVDGSKVAALSDSDKNAFKKLIEKSNKRDWNKQTLHDNLTEFTAWVPKFNDWVAMQESLIS